MENISKDTILIKLENRLTILINRYNKLNNISMKDFKIRRDYLRLLQIKDYVNNLISKCYKDLYNIRFINKLNK